MYLSRGAVEPVLAVQRARAVRPARVPNRGDRVRAPSGLRSSIAPLDSAEPGDRNARALRGGRVAVVN